MDHQLCPQSCRFALLLILAFLRPLQILSPFCAPLKNLQTLRHSELPSAERLALTVVIYYLLFF